MSLVRQARTQGESFAEVGRASSASNLKRERQLYSSVFQSTDSEGQGGSGLCVEVYKDCVAACTLPDLRSLQAPDHVFGASAINTQAAFDGTFPLNWAARFVGRLRIGVPGQ